MSSTWIRGVVCGTDNCRSRLWKTVDGRKICQYGHVKEGFEVGEDDDEAYGTQTRVITLPSSQRGSSVGPEEETSFFGAAGQALYVQCLQVILRKQIKWLINERGVTNELEGVVRSLWAILVNGSKFSKSNQGSRLRKKHSAPSAINDDESGNDSSQSDDSSNGKRAVSKKGTKGRRTAPGKFKFNQRSVVKKIDIIHLPVLCYLGCVTLRIPIYIYDFITWIERCQFPYMRGIAYLPMEMSQKLPIYYSSFLRPDSLPDAGKFHGVVRSIGQMYSDVGITFPPQPIEPLLFKLVHDLLLPPEIFIASQKLAESIELNLAVHQQRTKVHYKLDIPEVQLFAVVIVATKVCYGLGDEWTRVPNDDSTPAAQTIDWDLWSDLVRKIWLEDEKFFAIDDRDVSFWNKDKIDRYLEWVESNILIRPSIRPSYKRMLDLFPLGEYGEDGRPSNMKSFEPRYGDPITNPALHVGEDEVAELSRVVQSTTSSVRRDYEGQELEDIKIKGIVLTPGARYESYPVGKELPNIIQTIYMIGAKLCGVSFDEILRIVRNLDSRLNGLDFRAMDEIYR